MSLKEIKCPSGAILKVTPAPFVDSKNLYQALLRELKGIHLDTKTELASLYKELFCIGFSSPEIEQYLWKCMERCTYNSGRGDMRIDKDTFEPVECRDDYMSVCMAVAKENVTPFLKSLYAEYKDISARMENIQK